MDIPGKLPFETSGTGLQARENARDLVLRWTSGSAALCVSAFLPCLNTRSQPGHRQIQTFTAALRGLTAPCLARIHSMLLCFFTTALLPRSTCFRTWRPFRHPRVVTRAPSLPRRQHLLVRFIHGDAPTPTRRRTRAIRCCHGRTAIAGFVDSAVALCTISSAFTPAALCAAPWRSLVTDSRLR